MIPEKSNGEYLKIVIDLLVSSMSNSISPPKPGEDQDTLEYLGELREKSVELLTAIFSFLTEQNQTNIFSDYVDGFVKYLSEIVKPEFNCDIQVISDICGIIGDLFSDFSGSIGLYLDPKSLEIIYKRLENSSNPQHFEVLNYTKSILNRKKETI